MYQAVIMDLVLVQNNLQIQEVALAIQHMEHVNQAYLTYMEHVNLHLHQHMEHAHHQPHQYMAHAHLRLHQYMVHAHQHQYMEHAHQLLLMEHVLLPLEALLLVILQSIDFQQIAVIHQIRFKFVLVAATVKLEAVRLKLAEDAVELQPQPLDHGIIQDAHLKGNKSLLEHHGIMVDALFLGNRFTLENLGIIAVVFLTANRSFWEIKLPGITEAVHLMGSRYF